MRGIRFPLSHLFPLSLCAAKPKRACLLQLHFVFIICLFIRKFHSSITLVFQCCLFRILKTYANSRLSYPRCFVSLPADISNRRTPHSSFSLTKFLLSVRTILSQHKKQGFFPYPCCYPIPSLPCTSPRYIHLSI